MLCGNLGRLFFPRTTFRRQGLAVWSSRRFLLLQFATSIPCNGVGGDLATCARPSLTERVATFYRQQVGRWNAGKDVCGRFRYRAVAANTS